MIEIRQTRAFSDWLRKLRDRQAKARIIDRIETIAETGHLGDAKPVGDNVHELRIFTGPGYRVYFMNIGDRVILLLAGSDKDDQRKAIKLAKEIARAERT